MGETLKTVFPFFYRLFDHFFKSNTLNEMQHIILEYIKKV